MANEQSDADREAAIDVAMKLILDDSLDAEERARLKRALDLSHEVLLDVELSPSKGHLKRDLNDNESMLAWAVDYLADVVIGLKGVKTALSTRSAKAYADKNPLGGPATMFEAMAERIRAGEDYYAVLADYGLAHVPNGGRNK